MASKKLKIELDDDLWQTLNDDAHATVLPIEDCATEMIRNGYKFHKELIGLRAKLVESEAPAPVPVPVIEAMPLPDSVLLVLRVAMDNLRNDVALEAVWLSPEILRNIPTARDWLDTQGKDTPPAAAEGQA